MKYKGKGVIRRTGNKFVRDGAKKVRVGEKIPCTVCPSLLRICYTSGSQPLPKAKKCLRAVKEE